MKISKFFLTLLFMPILLSCQSKKHDTRQMLLYRIAQDSDYIVYQEAVSENAYLIALGKYDLAGIRVLYDKYPSIGNACDFNKVDLEKIRGGILYQQIHCEMLRSTERLNTKFQFYKLPMEDLQQIEMLYEQTHGRPNVAEKIYTERTKH